MDKLKIKLRRAKNELSGGKTVRHAQGTIGHDKRVGFLPDTFLSNAKPSSRKPSKQKSSEPKSR